MNTRRRRDYREGRHAGMTLLEVLVAMTVLTVGIVAVLGAFASSLRAQRASEEYTRAVMLMQQAFVELRSQPTLMIGVDSGTLEEIVPGYSWEAEIGEENGVGLLPVRMTILWGPDAAPRRYEVFTYLRQPEEESATGEAAPPEGGAP